MGGEIKVKSSVGKGTVFSFYVKVSHATESEVYDRLPQKRVKGLAPNQQNYRILVADDESANRLLLTQILKSAFLRGSRITELKLLNCGESTGRI